MQTQVKPEDHSRSFWLAAARLIWVAITLLVLALFIAALPYRYQQLQTISPQADTRIGELLPQEAVWLRDMGLSARFHAAYFIALEVLSALPFFLVAVFIFVRKSDDVVGYITSLSGILAGALVTPLAIAVVTVQPWLELPLLFLRSLGLWGLVLLYFIFPDGRLVPRWAPIVMAFFSVYLGVSLFVPSLRPPVGIASFQDADIPILVFNVVLLAACASAQVYRYFYAATPLQRQQTKWVVYGLAAAMSVLLLGAVLPALLFPVLRQPGIPALWMRFFAVTITLVFTIPIFPITIALAILRYRLWDIDLVIRRTLQYTMLTGLLSGIYFGSVALAQGVLTAGENAIDGPPPAVIVLTTLLTAALFNPLRRRLQDFIDRRFYRQKYDAERALADFAAAARSETDLDQLSAHLTDTVYETLQPEKVTLLLTLYRPANITGWLVTVGGFALAFANTLHTYMSCTFEQNLPLPLADVSAWLAMILSGIVLVCLFILLPALFPTGKFASKTWGIVIKAAITVIAALIVAMAIAPGPMTMNGLIGPVPLDNPFGLPLPGLRRFEKVLFFGIPYSIIAVILLGIGAFVARFRRSSGDERQQLKWFAFFLASVVIIETVGFEIMGGLFYPWIFEHWSYGVITAMTFSGFPIVIGLAVFKYRLYDIDLVIRRTLQYSLLTGLLSGIYFGGVALMQTLLSAVGGELSATGGQPGSAPVVIVITTLLIYILFNPLRRLQDFIDRRFYRRKYDAEKALDRFAQAARDETDLDQLSEHLIGTVQETLQPASTSLWIRSRFDESPLYGNVK